MRILAGNLRRLINALNVPQCCILQGGDVARRLCSSIHHTCTVKSAYDKWLHKFSTEGISEPRISIEIILSHVLGQDHVNLRHVDPLSRDQTELLNRLCECRLARMPVQYIIGEWQFRGIKLALSPPVFIPRPETETLVDLVLEKVSQRSGPVNILEVGCGSGAISLAVACESAKVICTAIDRCDLACHISMKNALSLKLNERVRIGWAKLTENGELEICSDSMSMFVDKLPKQFDIVVSNPPYVPRKDLYHLQPEIVLYEDLKALDGGKTGLDVVLPLLKFSSNVLKPPSNDETGGLLLIEVDPSHPPILKRWLSDAENPKLPLQLEKVHLDLFGKDRFVEFIKI